MKKDNPNDQEKSLNGARIAARILNRMSSTNKVKIFQAIANTNPNIAAKIEENLVRFEDIAELNSKSVQTLIRHINSRDLALSLKLAQPEVKDAILKNLSERARKIVIEDVETLNDIKTADVEDAKRRIIKILEDLQEQGAILSANKGGVYV